MMESCEVFPLVADDLERNWGVVDDYSIVSFHDFQ